MLLQMLTMQVLVALGVVYTVDDHDVVAGIASIVVLLAIVVGVVVVVDNADAV